MKHLYLIISILLCFVFVLGCVDTTAAMNNDTQPNSDETTEPIVSDLQTDPPSDTADADETTKPSETVGDGTAEPVPSDPPSDVTLPPDDITVSDTELKDTPDRSAALKESDKLFANFNKDPDDPSKVIYPDDFAGSYIGDDGYLHIMVTSSDDDVDYYTAIVDPSLVRFHTVKFSYNQLLEVFELLKPKMDEYEINSVSPRKMENQTYIQTVSQESADKITAFLTASSIDPGCYKITISANTIVPQ